MEDAYRLEAWHDLYVMLGGSCAALAGLLFVAVSLHVEMVKKSGIFWARAWANTFLIVMLVVDAAFYLAPQPLEAAGVEVAVGCAIFVALLTRVMIRVRRAGLPLPWRPFVSILLNLVGIVAGFSLVFRGGGGMYLATVQFLAVIVWVMFGAWGLLQAIVEDAPRQP
jgi:hypothetical protein